MMMVPTEETPKPDAGLKILTPSWDVLARYLTRVIMTIALATVALQAAKDILICMPAIDCTGVRRTTQNASKIHIDVCYKAEKELRNDSTSIVITTMADFRQYAYVDSACFQAILQWYPAYFPFVLFVEAVFLIVNDSFWFMYPKTSSALNHFVVLVMECYNSGGTFSDILQVLQTPETSISSEKPPKKPPKPDEVEMLPESPQQGTSKEEVSETESITFDMKAAMEVKTLYGKIEQFKDKYDSTHVLLNVYKVTVVFQIILSLAIIIVNSVLSKELTNDVNCHLDEIFLTKYEFFLCSRFIAPYYQTISIVFLIPVGIYLLTSIYSFCWTFKLAGFKHSYLDNKYVDKDFKIKGDLAFIISLLKQYNDLYSDRFLLFLSKRKKDKLTSMIRLMKKKD